MVISRGVLLMLGASFLFSVMNLLVKFISHIPATEIILFRSVISLVLCLVILKRKKIHIWGNNRKILILRGLSGATALITLFMLLQTIPLASATVLHYLSPIFTAIVTFIILHEKLYKIQWLFFLMCFAGILMIKGFDPRVSTFDLLLGIFSAFCSALAYTCIRVMKNSEHPLVIVLYFPLVTLPIVTVFSLFNWVTPVGTDWIVLIGVGLLTQFAQTMMTQSYQAEEAAKVASINYFGIIYALSFGLIFFNERFSFWVMIGIFLVISGVVLNVGFKRLFKVSAQ